MAGATAVKDSHESQTKLQFWLDSTELAKLDKVVREQGFLNRAEWFRAQVRRTVHGEA